MILIILIFFLSILKKASLIDQCFQMIFTTDIISFIFLIITICLKNIYINL